MTPDEPPPAEPPASTDRQQVDRLLALLEKEGRRRWPVMPLGCVAVLCVFLGMLAVCSAPVWLVARTWVAFLVMLAAGLSLWGLTRLATSDAQRAAARALTQYGDTRIVGPLITAMSWPDMELHRPALKHALVQLLPRMRASDAHLLDARQRAWLRRALRGRDEQLVIAILKALEQIGGREDMPHVERLARRRARAPRARAIQQAAEQCLTMLRGRLDQTGDTLLRAARSDAPDSESLLRPAGDAQAPPDTLLRPHDEPHDGREDE